MFLSLFYPRYYSFTQTTGPIQSSPNFDNNSAADCSILLKCGTLAHQHRRTLTQIKTSQNMSEQN